MSTVVIPGQLLASLSTHVPGRGTHVHENNIIASILGSTTTTAPKSKSEKPIISISSHPKTTIPSINETSLPSVGSIVLCRVTRVQQRQLNASILVILTPSSTNSPAEALPITYTPLTNDDLQFQAILRKEDIRAYEKDKIQINEMYRVGDIIRATVISLGDERNYYVSTAGNELGVVVATSEDRNALVPVSWKEMRDVINGKAEPRKVAKPV